MDLSFARFEHDATVTLLAPDLAVLLVGVAARQAASPTALVQSRLERGQGAGDAAGAATDTRFAPAHGAFDLAVADLLAGPAATVKTAFTVPVSGTPSGPGVGPDDIDAWRDPHPKGCF